MRVSSDKPDTQGEAGAGHISARDFRTKLEARRRHLEQVEASNSSSQRDKTQALKDMDGKDMDGIEKVLNELREYEDEVLHPLATEQV